MKKSIRIVYLGSIFVMHICLLLIASQAFYSIDSDYPTQVNMFLGFAGAGISLFSGWLVGKLLGELEE